ncbi:enoyl-CoA hydratase [Solimonas aquatica]|nr:enoyl-CoA hydratase [Solimonas aquatica]
MSNPNIQTELQDRVLTLRINRPEKKNALNQDMYAAMADVVAAAAKNDEVRVLLITGTGDSFCSGNDLQDFLQAPPAPSPDAPVLRFMLELAAFEKPVVAAITGPAVGIGTTLLFHVDLAYAAENARFLMPFVNIGICPEYASSVLLPRNIGHVQAAELVMLAEPFTAAKALDARLINAVLPADQVLPVAQAKARRLAEQAPQALRTTKALLKRQDAAMIKDTILLEAVHFTSMLRGDEAREALTAMTAKRKPDFSKFK